MAITSIMTQKAIISLKITAKVFIQPKRNKCKKRIILNKNETLYEISQTYGLKLKKLQKRNSFL